MAPPWKSGSLLTQPHLTGHRMRLQPACVDPAPGQSSILRIVQERCAELELSSKKQSVGRKGVFHSEAVGSLPGGISTQLSLAKLSKARALNFPNHQLPQARSSCILRQAINGFTCLISSCCFPRCCTYFERDVVRRWAQASAWLLVAMLRSLSDRLGPFCWASGSVSLPPTEKCSQSGTQVASSRIPASMCSFDTEKRKLRSPSRR